MSTHLLPIIKRNAKRASTDADDTTATLIHLHIDALPHIAAITRASTKDVLSTSH